MIVQTSSGAYRRYRADELTTNWGEAHSTLDREVTEAFRVGTARLYSREGIKEHILVIIDGGKNARKADSTNPPAA